MIRIFLEGMLLGFGAAVPLGPINILIMNEALRDYKKAVSIGLGALSADLTYLILILFGLTTFLQHEILLQGLSVFGGVFLLYMAYLIYANRHEKIKSVKTLKERSLISRYFKGFLLTLLSPYTILFWLSVTTYTTSSSAPWVKVMGMVVAILIWITVMPYIVYRKKHIISTNASSKIALISALILGIFGIAMLVNVFI